MKKLFMALVVVAIALAVSPRLRAKATPRLLPLWDGVRPLVMIPLDPFLTPLRKERARTETREISGALREALLHDQRLPRTVAFTHWVNTHHLTDHAGIDPWGKPYELLQSRDSVWVVSLGPDTIYNTADDVKAGFPYHH